MEAHFLLSLPVGHPVSCGIPYANKFATSTLTVVATARLGAPASFEFDGLSRSRGWELLDCSSLPICRDREVRNSKRVRELSRYMLY